MIIDTNKTVLGYGGLRLKHPFRVVEFYYPIETIKEEVYKRTSIIGKFRANKEGQSLFDLYSLSSDDLETFMMLLRQAADDIAQVLQPFMGPDECYIFNRDFITASPGLPVSVSKGDYVKDLSGRIYKAISDSDTEHLTDENAFQTLSADVTRSVHYILHRPVNTLPNMLTNVDSAILEAIVLYIIWQWLLLVENGDGKAQSYGIMWQTARTNVAYKMNLARRKTTPGHPF